MVSCFGHWRRFRHGTGYGTSLCGRTHRGVAPTHPHTRWRVEGRAAKNGAALWDAGTLEDLRGWKRDCGSQADEPFIAPLHDDKPFSRHTLRKRYRTACRVLRSERLETLTIHDGRHTYISHTLAGG